MAALEDKHKEEELKQELDWARTRALWVPFMKANFKKEGGGDYTNKDLIALSFDKEEGEDAPSISFKEAKAMLGARIKKDGKK